MRVMLRMLAVLLIVTTLAGNTARALDAYLDDGSNHVAAQFSASDDGDSCPGCPDHCGHSTAHFLGLHIDTLTIQTSLSGRCMFTRDFDRLTTRVTTPPHEPPRA